MSNSFSSHLICDSGGFFVTLILGEPPGDARPRPPHEWKEQKNKLSRKWDGLQMNQGWDELVMRCFRDESFEAFEIIPQRNGCLYFGRSFFGDPRFSPNPRFFARTDLSLSLSKAKFDEQADFKVHSAVALQKPRQIDKKLDFRSENFAEKNFPASNNETSRIFRNAFWQSFALIRAMFKVLRKNFHLHPPRWIK